jgi:hypothetical protein
VLRDAALQDGAATALKNFLQSMELFKKVFTEHGNF